MEKTHHPWYVRFLLLLLLLSLAARILSYLQRLHHRFSVLDLYA